MRSDSLAALLMFQNFAMLTPTVMLMLQVYLPRPSTCSGFRGSAATSYKLWKGTTSSLGRGEDWAVSAMQW